MQIALNKLKHVKIYSLSISSRNSALSVSSIFGKFSQIIDGYFRNVVCDLEHDIWCEALSSVSSALVALRDQSQGSTILSDFVRLSEFSLLIFQQHEDNFSKHFRRTFELHCELIKSKTSVTNANNKFEHVNYPSVTLTSVCFMT